LTLAEPTTTLTDYAMALVGWASATWLLRRAQGQLARRTWALGLVLVGVAAVLGGSLHGFAPVLSEGGKAALWRATYVMVGAANLAFLVGIAWALFRPGWARPVAVAVFAVHFLVFCALLMRAMDFGLVIQDYAIMLAAFAVLAVHEARRGSGAAFWLFLAIGLSALGGVVQRSNFGFHVHFNHNDIFHVLQSIGLWCYARGGALLVDAPPRRDGGHA
jgi:hypothetical protein